MLREFIAQGFFFLFEVGTVSPLDTTGINVRNRV